MMILTFQDMLKLTLHPALLLLLSTFSLSLRFGYDVKINIIFETAKCMTVYFYNNDDWIPSLTERELNPQM